MPEILLHVGFPKTATTWLQYILQNSENIIYIGKINGINERWCSAIFNDVRLSLRSDGPKVGLKKLEDEIHKISDENPGKPIVLSDEVLAKPWKGDKKWVEKFSQTLYEYFPEAKLLLTLRRQSDIASSLYRKHVSINGISSMSMRKWFDNGGGSSDITFEERWNLLNLYEGLLQFYPDSISIIPYEMMKVDVNTFCKELSDFFKLKPSELKFEKEYNVSGFKTNYYEVFRALVDPRSWAELNKSIKIKPKYDRSVLSEINTHFNDSNRQLSLISGLDLNGYGYFINE